MITGSLLSKISLRIRQRPSAQWRIKRDSLENLCLSPLSGRPVVVLARKFQPSFSMSISQRRCVNQTSAPTQQRSLNSNLGDTGGSPLAHLGGQLLNGSTSVRPNACPQSSLTSVMFCS
ncbi:hypothetical protein TNCV_2046831 [Trichonephila clavipes]|uniref:Uncharacterized protein n=1 Tax=Trichonephila clavipes TaxID=2585209 RepID=A0A8X6VH02_TRICX|nr:hypothetical protein TNCV_2046831 [Trichonephila clavipes]